MAWTKAKTVITTTVIAVILAAATTGVVEYKTVQTRSHTGLFAMQSEIQTDGMVQARVTLEFLNASKETMSTKDSLTLNNMGMNIERFTDGAGQPLKFTQKRNDHDSTFEYAFFLNRTAPPGSRYIIKMEGTVDGPSVGFLKPTGEPGVFEAQAKEQMDVGYSVHRTVAIRLPLGATLLDKSPNLIEVAKGGRIELRFDQVLPPPCNSEYHFRYRLAKAGE